MKMRLFAMSVLVAGTTLLALLALNWMQPTVAAQSKPASVVAPIPVPELDAPAARTVAAVPTPKPDGPAHAPDRAHVAAALRSVPLMFTENVGQFDADARFQVRRGNTTTYLADDAIWFTILEQEDGEAEARRGVNLKLNFPGANPYPRLEPFDRLDTHVSYFIGGDPTNWHADVPAWGGVRYVDLYPGVDLAITGEGGRWDWRLVARNAQSTISDIRLRIDGADTLALDGDYLRLTTAAGDLSLPLLQAIAAGGTALDLQSIRPKINGPEVMAPFSSIFSPPLSPQGADDLLYSTYLGGSATDEGWDIAVDTDGNAYVTGKTFSTNFPTTPLAFSTVHAGQYDVFVVKVDVIGSDLTYATFVGGSSAGGGSGQDEGWGIAVDGAGSAYVTGWTFSMDFPTTESAFSTSHNGVYDAFVVKLNADGTDLDYATFLGGGNTDWGYDIAVDGASAYVTGLTWSTNFPTMTNAYDPSYNGYGDAFVVKVITDGSELDYVTFLGGDSGDEGWGIAVDGTGNAYVTGETGSTDFPTTTLAFDTNHNGGVDAFVVKVVTDGSDLDYATFLGGSGPGEDIGYDIAVNGEDNVYVAGKTGSTDFPATTFDTSLGGSQDAFVARMNLGDNGQDDLLYATFLGGSGVEDWGGIVVDGDGNAYVTGQTRSSDFPTATLAFTTSLNGASDAYVVKVNAAGTDLVYATFLGGSGNDGGRGIAVDGNGDAYVAGITNSGDFPTTTLAFDMDYNGGIHDAFVTKLAIGGSTIYLPLVLRSD